MESVRLSIRYKACCGGTDALLLNSIASGLFLGKAFINPCRSTSLRSLLVMSSRVLCEMRIPEVAAQRPYHRYQAHNTNGKQPDVEA